MQHPLRKCVVAQKQHQTPANVAVVVQPQLVLVGVILLPAASYAWCRATQEISSFAEPTVSGAATLKYAIGCSCMPLIYVDFVSLPLLLLLLLSCLQLS